ncbi:hypothetical protein PR003_g31716 [Phytophthora rubi]|uniref:Uncharacterized protein n=1 Tax=Phytophthora rubi TaxID=129364 RepID=A0A6A4B1U6_9STRA|nr:hypothetical protein PR002_g31166 [Phytophthora rubi]KAE8957479.1 hypothetical protein PR001_g31359 [Phytophthora rubi]KAE9267624.1 hypothetical protein PR003_g31716 [Phytophthora rubi]
MVYSDYAKALRTVQGKELELLVETPVPIQLWEDAMREKRRREHQRRRMVNWRLVKKATRLEMLQERRVLEQELQHHVMEVRVKLDGMHVGSKGDAYRQSLVECAALTSENTALREALERQTSIKARLQRETEEFLEQLRPVDSPLLPPTLSSHNKAARCVQLPKNESSFYFTPFTKAEYDAILSRNEFADSPPCTKPARKCSHVYWIARRFKE